MGLIERLRANAAPAGEAIRGCAGRVVCKRSGEWVYWGYRPPPRPGTNTFAWERTSAIGQKSPRAVLADRDPAVGLAVAATMRATKDSQRSCRPSRAGCGKRRRGTLLVVIVDALRGHPARGRAN